MFLILSFKPPDDYMWLRQCSRRETCGASTLKPSFLLASFFLGRGGGFGVQLSCFKANLTT